jgi:hypothetical protein
MNPSLDYFKIAYVDVEQDKFTKDEDIKQKARSINLIKYNPNLFTNRTDKYEMIGGNRTLLTVLGTGLVFSLYRRRVNQLRNVAKREGIWLANIYALAGMGVGTLYSLLYFAKWQVMLNDYCAHYLLGRYPDSQTQNKRGIYRLKDIPNKEECYVFSQSYGNTFHI